MRGRHPPPRLMRINPKSERLLVPYIFRKNYSSDSYRHGGPGCAEHHERHHLGLSRWCDDQSSIARARRDATTRVYPGGAMIPCQLRRSLGDCCSPAWRGSSPHGVKPRGGVCCVETILNWIMAPRGQAPWWPVPRVIPSSNRT